LGAGNTARRFVFRAKEHSAIEYQFYCDNRRIAKSGPASWLYIASQQKWEQVPGRNSRTLFRPFGRLL
jgi:hypothetical protein